MAQITYERVPAGYVRSLEQHAATMESLVNERIPGLNSDHLHYVMDEPQQYMDSTRRASDLEDCMLWQVSQTTQEIGVESNLEHPGLQPHRDSPGHNSASSLEFRLEPQPPRNREQLPEADDIPVPIGASFFRTYFEFIHPQYPFLNLQECEEWYLQWKMTPSTISGWPAYFIKMVF